MNDSNSAKPKGRLWRLLTNLPWFVLLLGITATETVGAGAEIERSPVSLTLVPPSPVTDQIELGIRGAVCNRGDGPQTFELSFYTDEEKPENLLRREQVDVSPGSARSVFFRWPTKHHAGERSVLLAVSSPTKTWRATQPIEILASTGRSTRTVGGSWISFNLPEMTEGTYYDPVLAKMTDDQWREMVRGMHAVGMDVLVIQESIHNHMHYGQHNIPRDGYQGKAFYPSKLVPQRMPMAAEDPIEAVFAEADQLGMHVFAGVGNYAWFDFTPHSLAWHQELADELWDRYGHHRSFYGWYVGEEIAGDLGGNPQRWQEIVTFFREFQAHCRKLAPTKPVLLAPNCHLVPRAVATYPKLLKHLDILCPFGFHRMPPDDLRGEEAAELLQSLCDEAGTHLWLDMEVFLFDHKRALVPRSISGLISDARRFPNFEKILCYQYPGLMNAPGASIKPGGEATVTLFRDYKRYLSEGPSVGQTEHAALGKPIKLVEPSTTPYSGGGNEALADGVTATSNYLDPAWQGFSGVDLQATIDLGKPTRLTSISSRYFQHVAGGIFLPTSVQYSFSLNGETFEVVAPVKPDVSPKEQGPLVRQFGVKLQDIRARYVRVRAVNVGTIPPWHSAAGEKAWLFTDEITVNPRKEDKP